MKTFTTIKITIIFLAFSLNASSQIFWSENFGTSIKQGGDAGNGVKQFATNGAYWTMTELSPNGALANRWFVSSTEAGSTAGNCSQSYNEDTLFLNRTLHIGNYIDTTGTKLKASYTSVLVKQNEGNASRFGGSNMKSSDKRAFYTEASQGSVDAGLDKYVTDLRAETPVINCSGKSNISLSFDYFCGSIPGSDEFSVYYFDGTNWDLLNTFGPTLIGSCDHALWKASDSYILPSSANNNPNVKIGFRWKNNDDGIFSAFSVAIDNINLSGNDPTNQSANTTPDALRTANNTNKIDIKTQTVADKKNNPNIVFITYSEKFPANDLIIESSTDGNDFNELSKIKSKAVKGSVTKLEYNFTDEQANDGVNYYRVKQVNADKTTVISKIVSVDHIKAKNVTFTVYPNPNSGQFTVDFSGIENNHEVQIVLNDMNDGHEIYSTTFYSSSIDSNKMDVNPPTKIAPGRYICSLIFEGIRSSVIVVIN